jgi:endonuclease/exonuclease/phosphatase family metal-dependent hydrolase
VVSDAKIAAVSRPTRLASLATAVACLLLAGCGGDDAADDQPAPGSVELRVMSFNVWYGGVSVDFTRIAAAIDAADPDVIGIQEAEADLQRIADAAGYAYVDESLHLISRYPIFEREFQGTRFGYIEPAQGQVVAVENVHLTCCPYGPNLVAAGKSAEDVVALETRVRLPEAKRYAELVEKLIGEDVPVFMTGDFNSPSHLDWTEAATESRDLPYPVEWPASKALADAGLRDSYRDAHPDPAETPGLTWTAGQPPPRMRPSETHDRIDWVLAGGPSKTLSSDVVGETGGPDVGVGIDRWGSDHRAVVSSFSVEPAPAPYLVSADPRVVRQGDRVTLRYALAGGGPGRAVGIIPGGDGSPETEPVQTIPIFDASDHLAPMFGTAPLAPGAYRAALIDKDGSLLATSPFWIEARDAQPEIKTTKPSYAPGDPIAVRWANGPGNRLDYVAVFKASEPSMYGYVGYKYIDAQPQGGFALRRADLGRLSPGRYVVRLMLDDGYSVIAQSPFTVR